MTSPHGSGGYWLEAGRAIARSAFITNKHTAAEDAARRCCCSLRRARLAPTVARIERSEIWDRSSPAIASFRIALLYPSDALLPA